MMGFALQLTPDGTLIDFRSNYFAARCLLKHGDPYNQAQVLRLYHAESPPNLQESFSVQVLISRSNYPPSALPVLLPIAIWPLRLAGWLWLTLIASGLILAALAVWEIGSDYSPVLSGALAGALIGGNILVLLSGNAAGLAVSLSVLGAWCFFRNRFVKAGVFCFAVALMLKPHDAGLIWLYFLLADPANRKRALRAFLILIAFTTPVLVWLTYRAPGWLGELRSNLAMYAAPGSMNDPSPAAARSVGLAKIVNLQGALSYIWPDRTAYNAATYLVCGVLFLIWLHTTLRTSYSTQRALVGVAAASSLTMLPVYHRQTDATLLLLSIPACAILWRSGKEIRYVAGAITVLGILLTSDLLWAFAAAIFQNASKTNPALIAAQTLPPPLILLMMSVFYVWMYARFPLHDAHSNLRTAQDAC